MSWKSDTNLAQRAVYHIRRHRQIGNLCRKSWNKIHLVSASCRLLAKKDKMTDTQHAHRDFLLLLHHNWHKRSRINPNAVPWLRSTHNVRLAIMLMATNSQWKQKKNKSNNNTNSNKINNVILVSKNLTVCSFGVAHCSLTQRAAWMRENMVTPNQQTVGFSKHIEFCV